MSGIQLSMTRLDIVSGAGFDTLYTRAGELRTFTFCWNAVSHLRHYGFRIVAHSERAGDFDSAAHHQFNSCNMVEGAGGSLHHRRGFCDTAITTLTVPVERASTVEGVPVAVDCFTD